MDNTDIKGNVSLGDTNPNHTLEVKDVAKDIKSVIPETTDKEIIEKMEIPFKPVDNKLLVKPMKVEKIKKDLTILDEKKNKNLKPGDEMHTKVVTREVETDYRKGVVLAVGDRVSSIAGTEINIGDIIVYHKRIVDISQFDLFKDSLLLNAYDIATTYEKK